MSEFTTTLARQAVTIAAKSAGLYLRSHSLEATEEEMTESLRYWTKRALPEACRDAKDAVELGPQGAQLAAATFRASMSVAGINAAKEAGYPVTNLSRLTIE